MSVDHPGAMDDHFISFPDPLYVASAWAQTAVGHAQQPLAAFVAFNVNHDYVPAGHALSEALRSAAGVS